MQEPIIVCAGINKVNVQPFNTIGDLITLAGKLNAMNFSVTTAGESAKLAVTVGDLIADLNNIDGNCPELKIIDSLAAHIVQAFRAAHCRLGPFSPELLLHRVQAQVQQQAQAQATAVITNALANSGFIHDAI